MILVLPASTDYRLKDYGFGSGGEDNMTSSSYSLNAISGEMSGEKATNSNYGLGSGLIYTNQANMPMAPVLTNPNNYYNRLRMIINPSDNPSSAKFAVAISGDNFLTTNYVQNDNTVGNVLGLEDYQTYASWGGASGVDIIGLSSGTSYQIKVKAITGKFTETAFGPIASATTSDPTLVFDIDVFETDSESDSPYGINMDELAAGNVIGSAKKIWIDFSTNAENGGSVYMRGLNGGLKSESNSYLIPAMTGDLSLTAEGFGMQVTSLSQISGGPFLANGIYTQAGDEVGTIDQVGREVFHTDGSLNGGRGSLTIKAKSNTVTPAANDYAEVFTVSAIGSF